MLFRSHLTLPTRACPVSDAEYCCTTMPLPTRACPVSDAELHNHATAKTCLSSVRCRVSQPCHCQDMLVQCQMQSCTTMPLPRCACTVPDAELHNRSTAEMCLSSVRCRVAQLCNRRDVLVQCQMQSCTTVPLPRHACHTQSCATVPLPRCACPVSDAELHNRATAKTCLLYAELCNRSTAETCLSSVRRRVAQPCHRRDAGLAWYVFFPTG